MTTIGGVFFVLLGIVVGVVALHGTTLPRSRRELVLEATLAVIFICGGIALLRAN